MESISKSDVQMKPVETLGKWLEMVMTQEVLCNVPLLFYFKIYAHSIQGYANSISIGY